MALFGKKKTEDQDKKSEEVKPDSKQVEAESMADLYKEKPADVPSAGGAKRGGDKAAAESILISPLVTEKATNLAADNKYIFIVSPSANKISVARAVWATYGVKPLKVNVINMKGKTVNRGRVSGRRSDWRKAIVTLAKGETIKIYEGV